MIEFTEQTRHFIENNPKHVVMPVMRRISRIADALVQGNSIGVVSCEDGEFVHPFKRVVNGVSESRLVLIEDKYIDWTGHPNAHNVGLINAVAEFHGANYEMFMSIFDSAFTKDDAGKVQHSGGHLEEYNKDRIKELLIAFNAEMKIIGLILKDELDNLRADATTFIGIAEMGVGDLHERTFTNKSAYLMLMRLVRDVPLKAEDTDDLFASLEPEEELIENTTDWPQFWPMKVVPTLPEGLDVMVEGSLGINTDGDYVIAIPEATAHAYIMV